MNTKKIVPCCYFPTTVVAVDDSGKSFFDHLRFALGEQVALKPFESPNAALEYFSQEYKTIPYIKKWISNAREQVVLNREAEALDTVHSYTHIDIASIHKEIYSAERFKNIVTLVVDYHMPEMDGLKFSRSVRVALNEQLIKILMLTGKAADSLGLEALNDDVIDIFLKKGNDYKEKLTANVLKLQEQYFQDLSGTVIYSLLANDFYCLTDPVFYDEFHKIREQHDIVEYYLVHENGSFLMLDMDGKPYWFIVNTDRDHKEYLQEAQDNYGPEDIVAAFKNHKVAMCVLSDKSRDFDEVEDWRPFIHPLTASIKGQHETYHYALVEGVSVYDIDASKIATYAEFLKSA